MTTTLDIVLPVFALILAGYALARSRLIQPAGVAGLTTFVFYVAIPCMLFRSMARGLPPGGIEWGVVAAYYGASAATFAVGFLAGRRLLGLAPEEAVIVGMGGAFSNGVMIGLPLVDAAFGPAGLLPLMLVIAFHASLMMGGPTILMEIRRGRGAGTGAIARATVLALARNPVIFGMLAGVAWGALAWPIPALVDRVTGLLGQAAPAAALVALGASLAAHRLAAGLRETLSMAAIKLLLHPLLVWLLAVAFGLSPTATAVATITAALPVGANVFVLAQRYDVLAGRASGAVLVSTALSVVSVALLVHLFVGAG